MTKARKAAIMILSEFEEMLEKYEIDLPPRDEKEESDARLYGEDYYALEDAITDIIQNAYKKKKGK